MGPQAPFFPSNFVKHTTQMISKICTKSVCGRRHLFFPDNFVQKTKQIMWEIFTKSVCGRRRLCSEQFRQKPAKQKILKLLCCFVLQSKQGGVRPPPLDTGGIFQVGAASPPHPQTTNFCSCLRGKWHRLA